MTVDVEKLRRIVYISDRIKKIKETQKALRRYDQVRYSPFLPNISTEPVHISGRQAARLYGTTLKELKAELEELEDV